MAKEKTSTQSVSSLHSVLFGRRTGVEQLTKRKLSYSKLREIRKDPTVSLGRSFAVAPILTAGWAVEAEEGAKDEWVKFIMEQILPLRVRFLEKAMFGGIDFGWAPFEVVFGSDGKAIVIEKLKPLLQDITTILIDKNTGAFMGFEQSDDVFVFAPYALNIPFRYEGTDWYGSSLYENVERAYDSWVNASNGADRYDQKVAGARFVVYYPDGKSLDPDGVEVENAVLAQQILEQLEASGSLAVPRNILENLAELNKDIAEMLQWKIDVLEDKNARQPTFITRLKYLDTLKVRGLNVPERSIMEGTHGTLAEASAHIDLSLTNMDFLHFYVLEFLNATLVNTLLLWNFGKKAVRKVWITPNSLVDERRVYLQKVYLELLKADTDLETIDTDALKDKLHIPKTARVASGKAKPKKKKGKEKDAEGKKKPADKKANGKEEDDKDEIDAD